VSHPRIHAERSAIKFGGQPEDYLAIHQWFDISKSGSPDMRHRAMRHHAEGIFWAEEVFGDYFINSDGKKVFVRYVGEQHIIEDLGFIPIMQDWLNEMNLCDWMAARSNGLRDFKYRGDKLPSSIQELIDKGLLKEPKR
jgi:hypothetical protein